MGGFNSATCTIAGVGTSYQNLARLSVPEGLIQDLCLDDYDKLLANLGSIISTPKTLAFGLTQPVDMATPITVSADRVPLAAEAYSFDEATNTVTIKAGVVEAGKTVEIRYSPLP
jgi:hypothetical protein